MKRELIILSVLALIISACSTGSYVTTQWVDDVYFMPGDVPPPVALEKSQQRENELARRSAERVIISEITDNQEGSRTMSNYIFDGQDVGSYPDAQFYNLERMELVDSDTTVYYDENDVKYVINNYFEGDQIDFGHRIHRFHRPYFHDPFYSSWYGWDSWYYPYSSWSYGWGYNHWSWHSPYYSWYSPYRSWYSPYYSWYSPYSSYWGLGGYSYYGGIYSPYYGRYWGGGALYANRESYTYGQRRDFNTSALRGNSAERRSGTTAAATERSALKSAQPGAVDGASESRRGTSVSGVAGGGRPARDGGAVASAQSVRTHTELRREAAETASARNRVTSSTVSRTQETTGANVRESRPAGTSTGAVQSQTTTDRRVPTSTQGTYTRPVSNDANVRSGTTNAYVPSYNQQRTTTRSTYNVQGTARPASGQVNSNTATPASTNYTRPSSTSSTNTRTYQNTSTYNRSTSAPSQPTRTVAPSTTTTRSTYSPPPASSSTPSSSGSSYSAPARTSSSSSSGGSFSSGSSSSSSRSSGSSTSSSGRR